MKEGNLLARGFAVLERLSEMGSLSTEELYEQTRIPRSSVYRAASILEGLANDTREIVQLAIYENGMVRIVDNVRKYPASSTSTTSERSSR